MSKEKARSTICLFAASITGAWWERKNINGSLVHTDKEGDNIFAIFDDKTTTLWHGEI